MTNNNIDDEFFDADGMKGFSSLHNTRKLIHSDRFSKAQVDFPRTVVSLFISKKRRI